MSDRNFNILLKYVGIMIYLWYILYYSTGNKYVKRFRKDKKNDETRNEAIHSLKGIKYLKYLKLYCQCT